MRSFDSWSLAFETPIMEQWSPWSLSVISVRAFSMEGDGTESFFNGFWGDALCFRTNYEKIFDEIFFYMIVEFAITLLLSQNYK